MSQTQQTESGFACEFTGRNTAKLFAEIADSGYVRSTLVDFDVPIGSGWVQSLQDRPGQRLWRISSVSNQAIRSALGVPTPPLTNDEILAASTGGGSGLFGLQVKLATDAGAKIFRMDVGQTIETYARSVNLSILGPAATIVSPTSADLLQNTVIDALVGADIVGINTGSINDGSVRWTQRIFTTASTASVQVPAFAVEAKIQTDDGSSIGEWTRALASGGTPAVGTINFTSQGSSITEDRLLGNELFLVTPTYTGGITIVWKIRP